MKKNFLLLFTLLLLALVGTGCGDKVSGSLGKDGAELVGTWNGVGNALGRDDSYSCDYLSSVSYTHLTLPTNSYV